MEGNEAMVTTVIQDGALFFDDDTGDKLFASPIVVTDIIPQTACAARLHFELWAQEQGLTVEWAAS